MKALFRKPLGEIFRSQRLGESIVSVKIITVVLLTVFLPSVLIAVLGVLAVNRAEPIFRRWIEYPVENMLFELDHRLTREWNSRRLRYEDQLREARDLNRFLLELVEKDGHIADALLWDDGEFIAIEAESPISELGTPVDDPRMREAWQLESSGAMDEALARYTELEAADVAPEVEAEALAGRARALAALGKSRQAVEAARRLVHRFGATMDEAGIPRALPWLWRMIELGREAGDFADPGRAARDLVRFMQRHREWIAPDVYQHYRSRLDAYRRQSGDSSMDFPPVELKAPVSRLVLRESGRERLLQFTDGQGDSESPRSGYFDISASDGQRVSIAFFRLPEDGHEDRLVYLVLATDAFLADTKPLTRELKIPDALLRLGPGASWDSRELESITVVSRPFPRPFQYIRMYYAPENDQLPQQLKNLETVESMGFIWALVVLLLMILLGVMITVRSIHQEIQISKLKTDFVSFVTHELKTPLTAIRMFCEMLVHRRVTTREDERECVELIDKNAARLSSFIEQILEFSRIEKRQQVFHFTICDMSEVVAEAVRVFREQEPDDDIEIVVNQAQAISKILMDRSAMIELVLNLLSNAAKYTKALQKKIIVNLKESIDNIFVEVIDFGVGIPKGEQKKIFEKFYRAQDYLTRDVEGTGLGLTFAKYIADAHNGEIRVTSAVNQGSTFTLELRKDQVHAG